MKTSSSSASALLLVLWALMLLSATVLAWAAWMQQTISAHGEANRDMEARAMAHSGVALGMHPNATLQTPWPADRFGAGQSFRVRTLGEGGKLNINWFLRGEDPGKITILRQWLESRGLDFRQRDEFIDGLLDYADPDNLQRLNGREEDGTYHPANHELTSVDELTKIPAAAPLTSQQGWRDDLTVYSVGPIDMNSASLDILRLIPGLNDALLQEFVKIRQGDDGLDGTPDDNRFPSLDAIQKFFRLTKDQFQELRPLITDKDPTIHISSEGTSGSVTRMVEVVVRKNGGKTQVLSWRE